MFQVYRFKVTSLDGSYSGMSEEWYAPTEGTPFFLPQPHLSLLLFYRDISLHPFFFWYGINLENIAQLKPATASKAAVGFDPATVLSGEFRRSLKLGYYFEAEKISNTDPNWWEVVNLTLILLPS